MDGAQLARKMSAHVVGDVLKNMAEQLFRGDGGSESRTKHCRELLRINDVLIERGQAKFLFQELEQKDIQSATVVLVAVAQALKLGADLPQDEWGAGQTETYIDLRCARASGLIISAPTQVYYTNQVGGHANLHPSYEGYFVPIAIKSNELTAYFAGSAKWEGWCDSGIDEETARFFESTIEKELQSVFSKRFFSVDRTALSKSCEAWIYVDLEPGVGVSNMKPVRKGKGVFTWPNSD